MDSSIERSTRIADDRGDSNDDSLLVPVPPVGLSSSSILSSFAIRPDQTMTDDDSQTPADDTGFDDLLDELDEDSSFEWDDEELEADEAEEETRPVVCFRIGTDLFAIPGESVREIVGSIERTRLPGAPPHIGGITVVRRQVVGLLSLADFLDLEAGPVEETSSTDDDILEVDEDVSTERTLIVETPHYSVGIRVDEVTGLDEWPESLIDPETLPDNMQPSTRRYARGVRRQAGTMCAFLDLESLLDDAAVQ